MMSDLHRGHERNEGHRGKACLVTVRSFVSFVSLVSLLASAAPARAEIIFFNTGRTLSVKAHRSEGESLVLTLRNGGEIVCESSVVARITPDEVPYPEPVIEPTAPPEAAIGAVPYGAII